MDINSYNSKHFSMIIEFYYFITIYNQQVDYNDDVGFPCPIVLLLIIFNLNFEQNLTYRAILDNVNFLRRAILDTSSRHSRDLKISGTTFLSISNMTTASKSGEIKVQNPKNK